MKAKAELSIESLKAVIGEKKPTSMTKLAHLLGYKGSVSSSLTRKFRALIPEIDALLKGAEGSDGGTKGLGKTEAAKGKPAKVKKVVPAMAAKSPAKQHKAKPVGAKGGKYHRAPRNPFREGSSYGTVFDVLASHPDGMEREMLVRLVAAETGKDLKRAGFDVQVVCSARPNDDGLNNNDSPRNRSCRPGFWVKRTNGHVQLMVS